MSNRETSLELLLPLWDEEKQGHLLAIWQYYNTLSFSQKLNLRKIQSIYSGKTKLKSNFTKTLRKTIIEGKQTRQKQTWSEEKLVLLSKETSGNDQWKKHDPLTLIPFGPAGPRGPSLPWEDKHKHSRDHRNCTLTETDIDHIKCHNLLYNNFAFTAAQPTTHLLSSGSNRPLWSGEPWDSWLSGKTRETPFALHTMTQKRSLAFTQQYIQHKSVAHTAHHITVGVLCCLLWLLSLHCSHIWIPHIHGRPVEKRNRGEIIIVHTDEIKQGNQKPWSNTAASLPPPSLVLRKHHP